MDEISKRSADYQELIRTAVCIKYVIYINGGNATKTAVEDTMLLRLPSLDRGDLHSIMNRIEREGLDERSLRERRWLYDDGPAPTAADYPEMQRVRIKWYRGEPCYT